MADSDGNAEKKRVELKYFWTIIGLVLSVCVTVASTSISIVNRVNQRDIVALYESKEQLRESMDYRWENTTVRLKSHEDSIVLLKTSFERINAQLEAIQTAVKDARADIKVLRNGH